MKFLRPTRLFLTLAAVLLSASAAPAQTTAPAAQTDNATAKPDGAPLSYGLVVDNSGSLRAEIDNVIGAAKVFVGGNGAEDETFVVRFVASEQIVVLQDLTRSRRALEGALDDMYIEGGQTAVIDAVRLSADYLTKQIADARGRRLALVLLTDGEDRGSFYKLEDVLKRLQERKIQVYVLGFPAGVKKEHGRAAYERAVALINSLAEGSGGKAVVVERMSELRAGAAELQKHLRGN